MEEWNDGKVEYWIRKYELQLPNGERAMKKKSCISSIGGLRGHPLRRLLIVKSYINAISQLSRRFKETAKGDKELGGILGKIKEEGLLNVETCPR